MPLKFFAAGVTAVALAGSAAASMPLSAAPTSATPAIAPVVRQVPLPLTPEVGYQELIDTLNGLAAPGTFAGAKASYVQGGIGRVQAIGADRAYNNAVAKGLMPMTFSIANIVQKDDTVTADVTANTADGHSTTDSVTFVAGPSPSGWQLSRQSAIALLSAMH